MFKFALLKEHINESQAYKAKDKPSYRYHKLWTREKEGTSYIITT